MASDDLDIFESREEEHSSITILGGGVAAVQERRSFVLVDGNRCVNMRGLPYNLYPGTVHLRSALDPHSTEVTVQEMEAGLLNQDESLQSLKSGFIGKSVVVKVSDEVHRGTLVAYDSEHTVLRRKREDGKYVLQVLGPFSCLEVDHEKAEDLLDNSDENFQPSLRLLVKSSTEGCHPCDILYHAEGFVWKAIYSVVVHEEEDSFHLNGRFSITNRSGKSFHNAVVTVVAKPEEETSSETSRRGSYGKSKVNSLFSKAPTPPEFENLVGTYTVCGNKGLYLPNKKTIQYTFTDGVIRPLNMHFLYQASAELEFDGVLHDEEELGKHSKKETDLSTVLEIQNVKDHGLGMPLPPGELTVHRVRNAAGDAIQTEGKDGRETPFTRVESLHHSTIEATKETEVIRIELGKARGLKGTRTRTSYKKDDSKKTIVESFTITISNKHHKKGAIVVEDTLYRWPDWKVLKTSHDFHGNGANKIRWIIPELAVHAEETIFYTVQYKYDNETRDEKEREREEAEEKDNVADGGKKSITKKKGKSPRSSTDASREKSEEDASTTKNLFSIFKRS